MSLLTRIAHDLIHPSPWETPTKMHAQHDYLLGFRGLENLIGGSLKKEVPVEAPQTRAGVSAHPLFAKPQVAQPQARHQAQPASSKHPALAAFQREGKKLLKSDHQLIYKSYFENRPMRTTIIRNTDKK